MPKIIDYIFICKIYIQYKNDLYFLDIYRCIQKQN